MIEKDEKKLKSRITKDGMPGTEITHDGTTIFIPDPSPDEPVSQRDLQCNLSALLMLVVEQQALLSELLGILLDAQLINANGLERITGAKNEASLVYSLYNDFYEKYVNYFLRTKWFLLTDAERAEAENHIKTARGENSPKEGNPPEEKKDE